jgi:peptidylprolyl isomerase
MNSTNPSAGKTDPMLDRRTFAATTLATALVAAGPALAAGHGNTLLLETVHGVITIELLPDVAPKHVARMKELTKAGFYNGLKFHRVIEGFMAQTGDPRGDGTGGSDLPDLEAEFSQVPFQRGTLGMARAADPDSANSQFFIMFEEGSFLNGQYTVFGKVTKGFEALDKIKKGDPNDNGSVKNPDIIVKMSVGG